jgi:hypothetical protein
MADQEELVGGLAFAKQVLRRIEAMVAGAARHQLAVLGREAGKEGMLSEDTCSRPSMLFPLQRIRRCPDGGSFLP